MVISSGRGQQELLPKIFQAKPVPVEVGVVKPLIFLMNLILISVHVLLLSNIPTLFSVFLSRTSALVGHHLKRHTGMTDRTVAEGDQPQPDKLPTGATSDPVRKACVRPQHQPVAAPRA
jgi:hypothetical protein